MTLIQQASLYSLLFKLTSLLLRAMIGLGMHIAERNTDSVMRLGWDYQKELELIKENHQI